jgi:hypothetical protein
MLGGERSTVNKFLKAFSALLLFSNTRFGESEEVLDMCND